MRPLSEGGAPDFDPMDGGANAESLFVLEVPGTNRSDAMAKKASAANFLPSCEQNASLLRAFVVRVSARRPATALNHCKVQGSACHGAGRSQHRS